MVIGPRCGTPSSPDPSWPEWTERPRLQVVGSSRTRAASRAGEIYIPITTAQRTYAGANRIAQFMFTVGDATLPQSEAMAASVRRRISQRHGFDPEDPRALHIENNVENYQRIAGLINGIRLFVWVVGIGTILAGVVGVDNTHDRITVARAHPRDRGAQGHGGHALVGSLHGLQESVLITSVAGVRGLVLGTACGAGRHSLKVPSSSVNPRSTLMIAVQATLL